MDFTVVIPTYKSSGYIAASLYSIREATRSRNFEVLLVDDQSPDSEALSMVLTEFPEARFIRKPRKTNAADSRNIGIQAALADFIFLLDSDDHFLPGAIDRRMDLQRRLGAGVVFGNFLTRFPTVEVPSHLPEYRNQGFRDYILCSGGDFRSSTLSIHKLGFKGTAFDERTFKHQDWAFAIRCSDHGESIGFDVEPISRLNVDRSGRMSSHLNVQASRYFIDNYLTDTSHINSFSLRQWTTAIHNRDMEAMAFLASVFRPKNLKESLLLSVFQMAAAPGLAAAASSVVRGLRRGKRMGQRHFGPRQEAASSMAAVNPAAPDKCWGLCPKASVLRQRLALCETALALEDELSLDYLVGYQFDRIPLLQKKGKYPFLPARIAIFFARALAACRPGATSPGRSEFLFYAHTFNQFVALAPTASALGADSEVIFSIQPALSTILKEKDVPVQALHPNGEDLLLTMILAARHMPRLYNKLVGMKRTHSLQNHFNELCMPYACLPTFARVLSATGSRFIIQANDHTVVNRSLRLMAEVLHRRTVYLQHASVNDHFPALQFDLAFLDGMAAAEVYLKNHVPPRSKPFVPHLGKVCILLSGQKKRLMDRRSNTYGSGLGVAVNLLDDIGEVLAFMDHLRAFGLPIVVRTHPRQDGSFRDRLDSYSREHSGVIHKTPAQQSLCDFFSEIGLLIAGNTSIHLEAVLCGTPSFFHQLDGCDEDKDHYGYRRQGLVEDYPMEDLSSGRIQVQDLFTRLPDPNRIRFFSATFDTRWEGHEGELVAESLQAISRMDKIPDIFGPVRETMNHWQYEPIYERLRI